MEYINQQEQTNESKFPKTELREYEQYFFTESVLVQLTESLKYFNNVLCLCTPAVADAFYRLHSKEVLCFDIDERFSYLPNFKQCDITKLDSIPIADDYIPDVIIVDPPFFKMNLFDLFKCIEFITKGNKKTKIVFAFVIREEKNLLWMFKEYGLKLTKFKLEYDKVDPSKWNNYGIYANFETGRIKFVSKGKK